MGLEGLERGGEGVGAASVNVDMNLWSGES